jgi:hypothetical protein
MSTPERQQDSDPEKVSGYGGGSAPEPEQPDQGSEERTDVQPGDGQPDDGRSLRRKDDHSCPSGF